MRSSIQIVGVHNIEGFLDSSVLYVLRAYKIVSLPYTRCLHIIYPLWELEGRPNGVVALEMCLLLYSSLPPPLLPLPCTYSLNGAKE